MHVHKGDAGFSYSAESTLYILTHLHTTQLEPSTSVIMKLIHFST